MELVGWLILLNRMNDLLQPFKSKPGFIVALHPQIYCINYKAVFLSHGRNRCLYSKFLTVLSHIIVVIFYAPFSSRSNGIVKIQVDKMR